MASTAAVKIQAARAVSTKGPSLRCAWLRPTFAQPQHGCVVLLNTSDIETIVRNWSHMLGSVMHELSGWPKMAEQELDDESCRQLGFPEEFFTLCAEAGVSGSVTMLEVKYTVFRGVIGLACGGNLHTRRMAAKLAMSIFAHFKEPSFWKTGVLPSVEGHDAQFADLMNNRIQWHIMYYDSCDEGGDDPCDEACDEGEFVEHDVCDEDHGAKHVIAYVNSMIESEHIDAEQASQWLVSQSEKLLDAAAALSRDKPQHEGKAGAGEAQAATQRTTIVKKGKTAYGGKANCGGKGGKPRILGIKLPHTMKKSLKGR